MIAIPGDVFYHGSLLLYILTGIPIMALMATTVYIPVFRKLKVTSIFEVNLEESNAKLSNSRIEIGTCGNSYQPTVRYRDP